jgi:LemA protein
MANELDEVAGPFLAEGRDVQVIDKQLPVTIGIESLLFEVALWALLPLIGLLLVIATGRIEGLALLLLAAGWLPGLIFVFMKIAARNHFSRLQQRIQAAASELDNFFEKRVVILQNLAVLVDRAIDLDKDVLKAVAALRAGARGAGEGKSSDVARIGGWQTIDNAMFRLNAVVEDYPELQAHGAIIQAMNENNYLQSEITACRSLYNDVVRQWNEDVFRWPTKQIVAARAGFTTRIPFIASRETAAKAREVFF